MFSAYKLVPSHHVSGNKGPTKMSSFWKTPQIILNSDIFQALLKIQVFF